MFELLWGLICKRMRAVLTTIPHTHTVLLLSHGIFKIYLFSLQLKIFGNSGVTVVTPVITILFYSLNKFINKIICSFHIFIIINVVLGYNYSPKHTVVVWIHPIVV